MKLINRENGEELVEVGSHKDYASKGVAGAGLGLGIAGTALWLLSGGLGGGLFGNRFGAAGAAALGAESTVEKEDKCELVNGMWQLAFNGQTALNAQYHDNIELYKEWFGEDNIENIKDKIIESAIVNWFEDEDAGIEKVWNYFRAI